MFYIVLFAGLAILLVVAYFTANTRNKRQVRPESQHPTTEAERRKRKAGRAQSRQDRRKRH